MSQNVVALIVFLALAALVIAGTLVFCALVDRSVRRGENEAERDGEEPGEVEERS